MTAMGVSGISTATTAKLGLFVAVCLIGAGWLAYIEFKQGE